MSDAPNPFRSGMLMEHPADPCVLIIFGGTGDLAQRKLFPSLAHLVREGRVSEQTQFLCVSRKPLDERAFRAEVIENARKRSGRDMAARLAGEFMDAARNEGATIKKREDTHRMAEANQAFAHFRY